MVEVGLPRCESLLQTYQMSLTRRETHLVAQPAGRLQSHAFVIAHISWNCCSEFYP